MHLNLRVCQRAVTAALVPAGAYGVCRRAHFAITRARVARLESELSFDPDLAYYDGGWPVFAVDRENKRSMFFLDGFRILPAAQLHRGWFDDLCSRGVNVVAPVIGLSSAPFDLRARPWDFRTDLRQATQLYDAYVASLPEGHTVTVVAHSWGTVAALYIAATRTPDRIVLVAPFVGRIQPPRKLSRIERWLMHQPWLPALVPCWMPHGARGGGWNIEDPGRRATLNEQVFNNREHMLQHLSEVARSTRWLTEHLLGRIRNTRIDVLWGERDRLVEPRAIEQLVAELRAHGNDVTTTRLARSGHSLLMDACEGEVKRTVERAVGAAESRLRGAQVEATPKRRWAVVGEGWTVRTSQPVEYEVLPSRDILDPSNSALAAAAKLAPQGRPRLILLDAEVFELYGERVRRYLAAHGADGRLVALPGGEEMKRLETVEQVARELVGARVGRRGDPVIAIGGGVLLDVVGLATSLYRRGTPYVRVPTTLIGLIDAGIGVKTAVNFDGHKSRLGTYHASHCTVLDVSFLRTLPERHVRNGIAEIFKIALVKDKSLFELTERHGAALIEHRFQNGPLAEAVLGRAVERMLEELAPNLWEQRLERLADFGHSFSPAIEMRALPSLLHGEAVAIDIAVSTVIARNRGLLGHADADRVLAALAAASLPRWCDGCDPQILWQALQETTRHRDGLQRLPLLTAIGSATFVNDVSRAEVVRAASDVMTSKPLTLQEAA